MSPVDQEYVEAILIGSDKSKLSAAAEWLTQQELQVTPIHSGLLLSGKRTTFEIVFKVTLWNQETPISLPVPPELADTASSVVIPKPREIF